MGIEAAASASTVAISSSTSVNNASTTSKTNSDSSFKEEMSKVSESEKKEDTKSVEKDTKTEKKEKDEAKTEKTSTKDNKSHKAEDKNQINQQDNQNNQIGLNLNQMSLNDANMMLSSDIQQMIENTASISGANQKGWGLTFGDGTKSNIAMTESDADFFINLTQNDNINVQNMTVQAQNMLNNGADSAQVKQNFQVSQTLLNALSESRQNNQPVRIDFDQNVSVILRVGKDGALSAQFIPGDKAVEQYLRQNIDSLRTTFDEQDLPYSDLSYSNSSREQNQRRRQQQQQGE